MSDNEWLKAKRNVDAALHTPTNSLAELARLRADLAAAQAREQRMREALERWAAAFKTGRNEPLVIAYEAARAAQENPND